MMVRFHRRRATPATSFLFTVCCLTVAGEDYARASAFSGILSRNVQRSKWSSRTRQRSSSGMVSGLRCGGCLRERRRMRSSGYATAVGTRGGAAAAAAAGEAALPETEMQAAEPQEAASEAEEECDDGYSPPRNRSPYWSGKESSSVGDDEIDDPLVPAGAVVVVDPFCAYLGCRAIECIETKGYVAIQVLSDHLFHSIDSPEGLEHMRAPEDGEEGPWAANLPFPIVGVLCESDSGLETAERLSSTLLQRQGTEYSNGGWRPIEVAQDAVSEPPPAPSLPSDGSRRRRTEAEVELHDDDDREDVQTGAAGPDVGLEGGRRAGVVTQHVNEARRNKYLMNEALRESGLQAVRQMKTGDWDAAEAFLKTLPPTAAATDGDTTAAVVGETTSTETVSAVVKPLRGCGSVQVFLCESMGEAKDAFEAVLHSSVYGTAGAKRHEEVLLQERLVGQEYVVDTVSRGGKHKVMAVWAYDKRAVNGAPFVYHAVTLQQVGREVGGSEEESPSSSPSLSSSSSNTRVTDGPVRRVVEYARSALDALKVTSGPAHIEIIFTEDRGPVLVEVNCRWHLTDFAPLCQECMGCDAVESSVDALLAPQLFDALPDEPVKLNKQGRVVHLVCHSEGVREGPTRHIAEIEAMDSYRSHSIYPRFDQEGLAVTPTMDITSDAGWVRLCHEKGEVVERDYDRIVTLQKDMFPVLEEGTDESGRE